MSWSVRREYWFCAAHRLEGHEKCGRLHGHNYRVEVVLNRDQLKEGMVLDFALLDRACKPIVDELDHKYLISETNRMSNDPYAPVAREQQHAVDLTIYYTTAEEIAAYLQAEIRNWFHEVEGMTNFEVTVVVWETYKSAATYTT